MVMCIIANAIAIHYSPPRSVIRFPHARAVVFSAFSMHYPQCKRRAVRMRNCRAPRRRVRDVTRTRTGVTDETLSRKGAGAGAGHRL